jgi:hypothetical protein
MGTGGQAAMFHDPQLRDLSKFDVRRVPQTAALADQKRYTLHTRDGTLAWLQDVLTAGAIKHMGDPPCAIAWTEKGLLVSRNELFDAYEEWERRRPRRGHAESRETFGRPLQVCLSDAFVGGDLRLPKSVHHQRPRAYELASLSQCRAAFRSSQKMVGPWSADNE